MKSQVGRIVVGYDGSEQSSAALKWAAAEAERRGRGLTVLHVFDYVGLIPSPMGPFGWPDVEDESIARVANTGAEQARAAAGLTDVSAVTRVARVPATLIEFSTDADLLVVGTRGHGDLSGTVLGSVAFAVTAHARCPVVVVRGEPARPGPGRPVVVGVDGSASSLEAVRYGADLAAAAHAELLLVCAYRLPSAEAWAEVYSALEADGRPSFETVARQSSQAALAVAARIAQQAYPELTVTQRALEGVPARVLARSARSAGLLVVGSRGHGGFVGLMLGSVSHGLIHSAPCPVTVVHSPKGSDPDPVQTTTVRSVPLETIGTPLA
jgi:nucleotide-binding universal stress UspA family protein